MKTLPFFITMLTQEQGKYKLGDEKRMAVGK
jgi:hypothetical protein